MKTTEIYNQIIDNYSSKITFATIEEFDQNKHIQASINFENKCTISIVQNTEKQMFENYVKFFDEKGEQTYCKTTESFKMEDLQLITNNNE